MVELINAFQAKWRIFLVGLLVISSVLILPFLPHLIWLNPTAQAATSNSTAKNTATDDSPNLVTSGLFKGADGLERVTTAAGNAISNSSRVVTKSITTATVQSGRFMVHAVGSGVTFIAQAAGSGLTFIGHTTRSTLGLITSPPSVTAIIKPAAVDKTPVPIIEAASLPDAGVAQVATTGDDVTPRTKPNSKPSWPIHGVVTLEFGVPHWPYQPVHTGIDISDGQPAGITAVKPFKPGVVKEVVHSNVGFGNHVIIDHGGGLVSLYGHLASISVRVGQEVNKNTKLGYEGSTGASTGTHLHFEIRLNGQPVNPRRYIGGQP